MTKETVLKKDSSVSVRTRTGGSYSYQYTTLAQIHEYLESKGWRYEAFIKRIDGDDYMFITKIDENGNRSEPIQEAKIPNIELSDRTNAAQEYGSALTYARRYSLLMAYGLATEDDDAASLNRPKGGGSNRLDFNTVKAKLDSLNTLEEAVAYHKQIYAEFPNMTQAQGGAIDKMFGAAKGRLNASR